MTDSENKTRHALQIGGCRQHGAVNGHSSIFLLVAGSGQLIFARSGYPRLILLKASHADALITPELCVLSLHRDREVHAAQFQHHVIPRYWATECEGCTIFHPIGMYAPARTCFTPSRREFPAHAPVFFFFFNRYFWRKRAKIRVKRFSLDEFCEKKCHDIVMSTFSCCLRGSRKKFLTSQKMKLFVQKWTKHEQKLKMQQRVLSKNENCEKSRMKNHFKHLRNSLD